LYFEKREVTALADEMLTIKQVAKELQMHPDTIRRYIREEKLKSTRVGDTAIRIKRSDLELFLAGGGGQDEKKD
jgi:excisionase family DNA binding protein